MFVTFSCGCVGLVGVQGVPEGEGRHLVLRVCDGEDNSLGLSTRDMSGKAHEPVSEEKARGLIQEMSRLLMDGHRFREVRNLLR